MAEQSKEQQSFKGATGNIEVNNRDLTISRLSSIRPAVVKTGGLSIGDASDAEAFATSGMTKTGQISFGGEGSGPVARTPLLYWDPLMDPVLFLFPKDRLDEIYKRYRHYMEVHPIVSRVIPLHSTYPITDFNLQTEEPEITEYFNDFKERINMVEIFHHMLMDYYGLGESVFYGQWDHFNYEWLDFIQVPPENVTVKGSYITGNHMCFLKPDGALRETIKSGKVSVEDLAKLWDKEFLDCVMENQEYRLQDDRTIRLVRRMSKYQMRGYSLIRSVMKELMTEDKYRVLELTFADRHLFPLKIFKLGIKDLPGGAWIPPAEDFLEFQRLLAQADNDPAFSLVYHFGVEVEYVTTNDKIADLRPKMEFLEKRIMKGLMASESMISGEVPGYSSAMANLRVIMHQYHIVRTVMEKNAIYKIFLKLSQARNFVKRSKAELDHHIRVNADRKLTKLVTASEIKEGSYGLVLWEDKPCYMKKVNGNLRVAEFIKHEQIFDKYYLPKVIWKPQNLYNNSTMIEYIMRLRDKEQLPFSMVCDVIGLDEDIVKSLLVKEKNTIFDKSYQKAVDDVVAKDEIARNQMLEGKDIKDIIGGYLKRKELEAKEVIEKKPKILRPVQDKEPSSTELDNEDTPIMDIPQPKAPKPYQSKPVEEEPIKSQPTPTPAAPKKDMPIAVNPKAPIGDTGEGVEKV